MQQRIRRFSITADPRRSGLGLMALCAVLVLSVGCTPPSQPVAQPTEAAAPESAVQAPTDEPTVEPTTPAPPATDWRETATVVGDYVVRGNPAAPVRLVDYSDFM